MPLTKFFNLNADISPLPDYLLDLEPYQLELLKTSLENLLPLLINAGSADDLETVIYNALEINSLSEELIKSFENETNIQEATETVVMKVNEVLESIDAVLSDVDDTYNVLSSLLVNAVPGVRIQVKQPDDSTRTFLRTEEKTWVEEK